MVFFHEETLTADVTRIILSLVMSAGLVFLAFLLIFLGMHTDTLPANSVVPLSPFILLMSGIFFARSFDVYAQSQSTIAHRKHEEAAKLKAAQKREKMRHDEAMERIRKRMQDRNIVRRAASLYRKKEKKRHERGYASSSLSDDDREEGRGPIRTSGKKVLPVGHTKSAETKGRI
jgi:type IV secretory pathway VirB6-like protein